MGRPHDIEHAMVCSRCHFRGLILGFAQDLRKGRGRDSYQVLAIIALLRLGRVLQGFENVDWTLGVNWLSLLECLYLPLLAVTAFFLARKLYPDSMMLQMLGIIIS